MQESPRRQSLHRRDRRAQPRRRQDEVVLPVVAARHARLGRDADAGAVRRRLQRPAAQDARAGVAQRQVLRPRSRDRQGAGLVGLRVRPTGPQGFDKKGRADSEPGEEPADRRRAGDAEPGGRRQLAAARRSVPRPACSTSAPRRPTASGTSTIRATIRRDGAGPIAAAGRRTWCRRSTTRPARCAGATSGKAAACRASSARPGTCSSPATDRAETSSR